MSVSNPWFWLALVATIGVYKVELLATLLNLSRLGQQPPPPLGKDFTAESWGQLRTYVSDHARLDIIKESTNLVLLMAVWWGGGFNWLAGLIHDQGFSYIIEGLAILGSVWFLSMLISLPFDLWSTFGIETRYGFNKTTFSTFVGDRIKGTLLGIIVGAPLAACLIWLLANVQGAAFYGWLVVCSVTLLMSFIAPKLLMPLFFKFEKLEDESLRHPVLEMAKRLGFPVAEVNVIDGSRRSTKANAFLAGYGRMRRIALFDTLINTHSKEEILAVLAHEIGHWKRGHVLKQMILSVVITGLLFGLLHLALHDPRLPAAFTVQTAHVAWTLVFFSIILQPVNLALGAFSSWLSRKYEFEADAFAREAMNTPEPLAAALQRLSVGHMSHPTPHPFHVFLYHSHPPVLQRLTALQNG